MKAIRLALLELRRFRGGGIRLLIPVVLALTPLLYGSLWLWSHWNPYGNLHEVPVAVTNSDRPVTAGGRYINAGEQFVQQLKTTELFDWHFVNPAEARSGLREGSYYFAISIPADFSAKLATATQRTPERATLTITKNDANGYLAGIMADTARAELQNQVDSAAHAAYARAFYSGVDAIREKLQRASDTAEQLIRDTELNEQGLDNLTEGLAGLRDSSRRISGSVQQVTETAAQLDSRLDTLADTARTLPETAGALVEATESAMDGMRSAGTAAEAIAERATGNVDGLNELGRRHPELTRDPVYRQVLGDARALAEAAADADRDAQRALSAARQANSRAVGLRDTLGALRSRISTVTTSAESLRDGSSQLTSGTQTLTSGLDALLGTSETLRTGSGQLTDGARQLAGLIDDSRAGIPPTDPTRAARAAEVLGSPASIDERNLNPAHVYGRGLAPFWFAVALWLFGLLAYPLFKPVNLRALAGRVSAPTIALAGWLPVAVLGVLGALVLLAVADLGLGLDPRHLWATIGLLALAASAFVAITHFLRTWLAAAGGYLSLVLLVVQLTASGGLYPMETTPVPFQALHPLLPMTYLVDGLRITISGGPAEHLVRDAAVLGGFLLAALVLTSLTVRRRRTWTVRRLHPQVE
ncbi:putative membrane protein [Halopolyspora algeriensis]|uniref:Putative membrane protein n=1 Tax=Halopolyspora algeriensis TaxID=1500506 RepID=A0A368VIW6_9ACTN|nr:YhgE/Pip domain-containing protein [Halopolyspora algeriensis]RCW40154.1 putative membrane protein [Halopolyspora algeriensis]TQM46364.1 putative membrane protein [Halopolyspora algeriensis]